MKAQTALVIHLISSTFLGVASTSKAQDEQNPPPESESRPIWEFSLGSGFSRFFEADLNEEGSFDIDRFYAGLHLDHTMAADASVSFRWNDRLDSYDFDDNALEVVDAWEEIYTHALSAILSYDLSAERPEDVLSLYFPGGHIDQDGHAFVAEKLIDWIEK